MEVEDPKIAVESSPIHQSQHEVEVSLGFDNDPPAFCESFQENPLEICLPPTLPFVSEEVEAIPVVEERPTAESKPISQSSTPVELTKCSPEKDPIVIDLRTPNDSHFFDDSMSTPVPLAKRLRASFESAEVADALTRLSSNPAALEVVSDQEEVANSPEDNVNMSFSQPEPIKLKTDTRRRRRRASSIIKIGAAVTPKPAFEAMKTPDLRKALSDYGVRHLPKKKAILLLNHIYDELHPYVEVPSEVVEENGVSEAPPEDSLEGFAVEEPSIKTASLPPQTTSARSSSSKNTSKEQEKDEALKVRVMECLRNDENIYHNIVTYVPLELDCVKALLRDAGVKIGLKRLTELLDSWGVTFTTRGRNGPKPHVRDAECLW